MLPKHVLPVFVYGTLMPGQLRWPALSPFARSVAPAVAWGALWDTGDGYPAAVFAEGGGEIPGVVVTLDPGRWAVAIERLDEVEYEGVEYRRVEIATSQGPAMSYEWLGPTAGLTLLPQGWPPLGQQTPPRYPAQPS